MVYLSCALQELASALLRDRIGLFASSAPRLSSLVLPASSPLTSTSTSSGAGAGGAAAENGGAIERVASPNGDGAGGAGDGESEEGRVAVLRTLLARVRLEEDRAVRSETRASLMALVEPSSAVPVREHVFARGDYHVDVFLVAWSAPHAVLGP